MTLTDRQEKSCKKSITIKVTKKDKEYDIKFFIVENVDEDSINLHHKVQNEIDAVYLVPLYKLSEKYLKQKKQTVSGLQDINCPQLYHTYDVPEQTKQAILKYLQEKQKPRSNNYKSRRFGYR